MGIFSKKGKKKPKEPEGTEKKLRYGNWLFNKEGTVAQPWPTAKELWEKPEVQKAIQAHNKYVRRQRLKKNK